MASGSRALLFVLVTLGSPLVLNNFVQATPITLTFNGTCTTNCSAVGQGTGGRGTAALNFQSLISGAPYPNPDNFFFDLGTVHIDRSTAVAFHIAGTVSANIQTFTGSFAVSEAIFPSSGDTVIAVFNRVSAGPGQCFDGACLNAGIGNSALFEGTWSNSQVNEPRILLLLLPGLVFLRFWCRQA